MPKPESKSQTIQEAEKRYELWRDYFLVTPLTPTLRAPMDDLRELVLYTTYLKQINASLEKESIWNFNSAFVGFFIGILVTASIFLLGIH